ncbi:MAG: hypothetical protein JO043_13000, partial [Candidatus Eremiobacteraeota bacterium]|nr:hypothetical protein [Candidatus Eremiobacteraeota bacterium]
ATCRGVAGEATFGALVTLERGAVVAVALGRGVGRGVARIGRVGEGSGTGVGDGCSVGPPVGAGVNASVGVAAGTGDGATTTGVGLASAIAVVVCRWRCVPSAAPITRPTTTIPTATGMTGKLDSGRVLRRIGGWEPCVATIGCSFRAKGLPRTRPKPPAVIRVPVPVDFETIEATASDVFAAATPLRIGELLALAVREALGVRAPIDKLERGIRATLASFSAGEFLVDVDGRTFRRPNDIVMCAGYATLRFYARTPRRGARRRA